MYRPYNRGEAGSILQASAPSNREGGYIGTQRLVQSLQQSSWPSMMGATVHSWQNCHFQSLALIPGNQSATFASGLGWGYKGALLAAEAILTAVFSGLR